MLGKVISTKKIGLSPGSLIYIGNRKVEEIKLALVDYDSENLNTRELTSIEEAFPFKETPTVTWLDVIGLHDMSMMQKIGNRFGIHPLIMEDILNFSQRPKVEIYDDYIFIVLKKIRYDEGENRLKFDQISFLLGANYVISFQERVSDVFDPVLKRIRTAGGRIRKHGPDYLVYALIDVIIDNYYLILEEFGNVIETMEDNIWQDPQDSMAHEIQRLKRQTVVLARSLWSLREATNKLQSEDSELIKESTFPFLRDLHDHTVQIVESVEIYREMTTSLMDLHLSNLSVRMNEVMKVLTIIATIFIPLTFIVGIYGMNFENMPELHWAVGHPIIWLVMVSVTLFLIYFFKRKHWF
ncbi:MAG: magnesium/cobalt transporter CorA [Calditrichales bacterium]|nr:MAG: magnesium/cobalt transporter CorA [Calditrichales bacterium]